MTNRHPILRTAFAATLIAAASLSAAAHADTGRETAKFDAKTNSYCVTRMVTGSILPKRVCATRRQWIDQGATLAPATVQVAAK